ncbi:TRAP transporter substrate-binding protein [Rhizobium sp. SGZ-381]|uniref:TRAP transporter substrate-binding protein n=1 Tax=Rhizobium sp. SGZ-381 TaxID=3342800 RepID=UPI00366F7260
MKISLKVARAVLAAALATALSASALQAATLRLGSGFGDKHSSTIALRDVFGPEVEKRTEGRYAVKIFANSELGQASEMINQAQSGINFGVYVSSAFFNAQVPQIGVTNLPFLFPDRETAFKVIDGPVGQKITAMFDAKGLSVLGVMELGFRNITNSKHAIKEPKDLAGLKIRLQNNPVHIATFQLLGASPTSIDASEMYSALSQGVADGQENPYAVINSFQLYDAKQKFMTNTGHFFDVIVFAVSKSALERMSPADQAAVREAARLATAEQRRLAAQMDADNLKQILTHQVEFTELTDDQRAKFREATAPVYSKVRDTIGAGIFDEFTAAVSAAKP